MPKDLNKYDELNKVINSKPLINKILECFSPLSINEFKLFVNNFKDYFNENKEFNNYDLESLSEVLINSKVLYDFEKIFPNGIDKIRACTKYISKSSEIIRDNIERTNFITINSYMTIYNAPENIKKDILQINNEQYDNFDLLSACLLLTLNIIDKNQKFNIYFNDKISKMSSNIFSFIYIDSPTLGVA